MASQDVVPLPQHEDLIAVAAEGAFQTSYGKRDSYPQNLIYQVTFGSTLKASTERLAAAAMALFGQDTKAIVAFRDLKPDGKGMCEKTMNPSYGIKR